MSTDSHWPKVIPDDPCHICGSHKRGCTRTKDRRAGHCHKTGETWHDRPKSNGNGTGYAGAAHRPRQSRKASARAFASREAAIEASLQNVRRDHADAELTRVFEYQDANGGLHFCVARFDWPGDKSFRPVHPHKNEWREGDPAGLLPLYRRNELPSTGTIYVGEGEKATDAAWSIGLPATTSAHGASAAEKTDWTPLAGRDVVILPDADEPGAKYARQVATILLKLGCRVKIINLPGLADHDDIVEFIEARDSKTSEEIAGEIQALADSMAWEVDGFKPVSLGEIWQSDPELREPIIEGLLRRGEVGNLISTSKAYKTYLVLGLAISMVTGRQWLERFACSAGKVLIIDLELQKPNITKRTKDIAAAMHVAPEDIADKIEVISLRGRAATIDEIERIVLGMKPRTYSAIIIDPLYKTYPQGFDENSNSQMTALYRRWERMAEHLDGGLLIVHHGTKGSQSEKRVVDVGAGASAQSRSADCHIALREHEQPDAIVFDARVRSFPPVEPIVLRWQYPTWQRDISLNPKDLKTGRRSRSLDKEPQPVEPKAQPWTVDRFVETFITDQPQTRKLILARARQAGVAARTADDLIELAVAEKKAFVWAFDRDKNSYLANGAQPVTAQPPRNAKITRRYRAKSEVPGVG